jgi:hypothetical protein
MRSFNARQKQFAVAAVAAAACGALAALFLFMHGGNVADLLNLSGTHGPERAAPAGEKEYRSDAYHFSLLYPENLSVHEYPESGGAITVTFEDVDALQGFQVYIAPFAEQHVTEERFAADEPSGVRQDPKDITVDGAVGAAFYSWNDTVGDTSEVWFIHGGYLYEATSIKPLDAWFREIMSTWKFI